MVLRIKFDVPVGLPCIHKGSETSELESGFLWCTDGDRYYRDDAQGRSTGSRESQSQDVGTGVQKKRVSEGD